MGPEVWVLRSGLGRRAPEGFAISCSTSAFLFGNYAPRMPVRTVLLQNIDKPSGIIGALCNRSPNLFASELQLASAGCAKRLQLLHLPTIDAHIEPQTNVKNSFMLSIQSFTAMLSSCFQPGSTSSSARTVLATTSTSADTSTKTNTH